MSDATETKKQPTQGKIKRVPIKQHGRRRGQMINELERNNPGYRVKELDLVKLKATMEYMSDEEETENE